MKKIFLSLILLLSVSFCFAWTLVEEPKYTEEDTSLILEFYSKGRYVFIYETNYVRVIPKSSVPFIEIGTNNRNESRAINIKSSTDTTTYLYSKYKVELNKNSDIIITERSVVKD